MNSIKDEELFSITVYKLLCVIIGKYCIKNYALDSTRGELN